MEPGQTQPIFPTGGFGSPYCVGLQVYGMDPGAIGLGTATDCMTNSITIGGSGYFKVTTCEPGSATFSVYDGATFVQHVEVMSAW